MEKALVFEKELSYIVDNRIRESARKLVNLLPDYFFEISATASGKYHPSFSHGEGGLVRHTKVVVRFAYELLYTNNTIGDFFTNSEKDLIILSLIIHDGLKRGEIMEDDTRFDHPILAANFVEKNKDILTLTGDEINIIKGILEAHMGQWTKDKSGVERLRKPETKCEKFAHMCDYLGSRKFLDMEFLNND